jgi:hypothetical protein
VNGELLAVSDAALGWLFPAEGPALYEAAMSVPAGPLVEVGSYCGKSTVFLGEAARALGTVVFAVDHHRGSPEMQPGRENHDRAVVGDDGAHDTLFHFRATVAAAGLESSVVAVVGSSTVVASHWRTPVGLVFVDAGHDYLSVRADFVGWAGWVVPGGVLAFHDTTIEAIDRVAKEAVGCGFVMEGQVDTLRILRRPG